MPTLLVAFCPWPFEVGSKQTFSVWSDCPSLRCPALRPPSSSRDTPRDDPKMQLAHPSRVDRDTANVSLRCPSAFQSNQFFIIAAPADACHHRRHVHGMLTVRERARSRDCGVFDHAVHLSLRPALRRSATPFHLSRTLFLSIIAACDSFPRSSSHLRFSRLQALHSLVKLWTTK